MELSFARPELRAIDELAAEVLVASMWEDKRPLAGVLGLVDYRLLGRVSALCAEGFVRGTRGEVSMLPARPRLPFDKLLVVGMGAHDTFDAAAFHACCDRVRDALLAMRVKRVVVELPGRFADSAATAPREAAQAIFRALETATSISSFIWLEPESAQAEITAGYEEALRKARRG
jgi:hypothetical protein